MTEIQRNFNVSGLCPDWDEWNPENAYENANTAMDLAQSHLDVPKVRGKQYFQLN